LTTRCYRNNKIEYKCIVRASDASLVVENLEMLGEVKRIHLKNVKEVARLPDGKLEIRTVDGDVVNMLINELVRKDVEYFMFLYYFTKEQQNIRETIMRNLHNYIFLIQLAFKILQSLTKGNIPQWGFYRELIKILQDFNDTLSSLEMKELSEALAKYIKTFTSAVERRSVSSLVNSLRNYVKFLTAYFSSFLRETIKYFDPLHFVDLTLIAYIHFYSKNLGLPLQAERARREFEYIAQEQVSKLGLLDELLKERITLAMKLLLQTSRGPEEIPQRLMDVVEEEINRYVLQT